MIRLSPAVLFAAFVGALIMTSVTSAVDRVVLGTATPGGGFPVYGAAVAETINETDPTLAVETRNTKGSTENVPLLEAGQIDLGLVTGEVAYEAMGSLKILTAMYPTPGMFVVRADSAY